MRAGQKKGASKDYPLEDTLRSHASETVREFGASKKNGRRRTKGQDGGDGFCCHSRWQRVDRGHLLIPWVLRKRKGADNNSGREE